MCLGDWSLLGLVNDSDVMAVMALPDMDVIDGDDEKYFELKEGWDSINL